MKAGSAGVSQKNTAARRLVSAMTLFFQNCSSSANFFSSFQKSAVFNSFFCKKACCTFFAWPIISATSGSLLNRAGVIKNLLYLLRFAKVSFSHCIISFILVSIWLDLMINVAVILLQLN